MVAWVKQRLKWLLDRLFLRSSIAESQVSIRKLLAENRGLMTQAEALNESLLIAEKKIEYVSTKLAAYAEAQDQFNDSVIQEFKELRKDITGKLGAVELHVEDLAASGLANFDSLATKIENQAHAQDRLNGAVLNQLEETIVSELADIREQAQENAKVLTDRLAKAALNEFRQSEAMTALLKLLNLKRPLPATRRGAASPDFLLHLYEHIGLQRPKIVVELGSGVSSIVAAAALKANGGGGRLYSLEHDSAYAERTSNQLAQQELGNVATIYHASLAAWKPASPTKLGEEWQWYSVPKAVEKLKRIELLIVDGPPGNIGPFARYPALPHFFAQMVPGCVILMDDASRKADKVTAETWSRECGLRLEIYRRFEKGLAVLTLDKQQNQVGTINTQRLSARHQQTI